MIVINLTTHTLFFFMQKFHSASRLLRHVHSWHIAVIPVCLHVMFTRTEVPEVEPKCSTQISQIILTFFYSKFCSRVISRRRSVKRSQVMYLFIFAKMILDASAMSSRLCSASRATASAIGCISST